MIGQYDDLYPALYAGNIEDCFRFLDERLASDGHSADYWHWRAVTHLRAGQFLKALDICFKLTREFDIFAFHVHCLCDICAHLGLKEIALAALEYFARKPATAPIAAYLWRVYGWHYLGEDDPIISLTPEGLDEHSQYVLGHHQARSVMRRDGIAHGVAAMHRYWSSNEARRVLFPHLDLEQYWTGQRALPARLHVQPVASGYGDLVNWARYIAALEAMGVEVQYDTRLFRLSMPQPEQAELARAMHDAGFTAPSGDTAMWTDPFTLFTALFPVLGYAPSRRYIEPADPSSVDAVVDRIRQRARGRRCVCVFWSSCESANNFANRSLCLPDLDPLFDSPGDIYWVIMQRGFERRRWLNDPRSADLDRFATLDLDLTLGQSAAVIDRLDAFVGNDGGLSHIAGALGKRSYMFLNHVAEWRYERAATSTPWYPTMRLVRARELGGWTDVVATLQRMLHADV
ncbi:glycosyltransferase family 9 protein [Caballeronia concitans]|uniref:TPR domain-containing protein n=1 Tax=Caballeronia concitans TaxID=1777133 RepID=A0A658QYK4_9BURK|nr:glycosyltransferase family 9 protein [Caballeronia concitans]KIG11373.1 glycosyl transferase family 9 [Burkholderia sp. MR1]SAL32663.1 TPR domain-containing protein [Caballeronia concitans]